MALAVPVYHSVFLLFSYGGRTVKPPILRSKSHEIPIPIWELSLSGWYCVKTPTVSMPELMPVSYTHLDVYKRQALSSAMALFQPVKGSLIILNKYPKGTRTLYLHINGWYFLKLL